MSKAAIPAPASAEFTHRLRKHSIVIAGHRTSISLEDAFWLGLQAIAARREISLAGLVASIDADRGEANLSSAIRVYVLEQLHQSI